MNVKYQNAANIVICIAGICAAAYLFFKYALSAFLPFLLGWLISLIIYPLSKKLSSKLKISERFASGFLVIFFFLISTLLIGMGLNRLWAELSDLAQRFYDNPQMLDDMIDSINGKISAFGSKFPLLEKLSEVEGLENIVSQVKSSVSEASDSFISYLTAKIPAFATKAVVSVPGVLLFIVSFLLSCFYFCVDREKCNGFFVSLLPQSAKEKLPRIKKRVNSTVSGYIKAYLLLMCITFFEVFIGLSVIKVEYAFLLAAITAIVDLLPVFGAGTILVPWAIYAFLVSDTYTAIGLLVIFGIITAIRQIIEPKIIGKKVGLHPLAMLLAVYAGIKFLGISGIFIGPLVALAIKEFLKSNRQSELPAVKGN